MDPLVREVLVISPLFQHIGAWEAENWSKIFQGFCRELASVVKRWLWGLVHRTQVWTLMTLSQESQDMVWRCACHFLYDQLSKSHALIFSQARILLNYATFFPFHLAANIARTKRSAADATTSWGEASRSTTDSSGRISRLNKPEMILVKSLSFCSSPLQKPLIGEQILQIYIYIYL